MAGQPYKLALRLTPRSGRDAVLDNGKANKALCKLIASELGIAKSKVEVVQGQTSRHKRLAIDAPEPLITAWLSELPDL